MSLRIPAVLLAVAMVAGPACAAPTPPSQSRAGGLPAATHPSGKVSATVSADSGTAEASPAGPARTGSEQLEAAISRAVELRVEKRYDAALDALASAESGIGGPGEAPQSTADARAEIGYQRGLVLEESGRLPEAAAAYEGVTRDQSNSPAAWHARLSLAGIQGRMGKPDDAAETYRSVLRLTPKLASAALLGLAGLEESRGRPQEAAAAYRNIVRNFPNSPEMLSARKSLAGICARLVDVKPSTTVVEDVLAAGECLMDANRAPEAQALYEASLKRRYPPEVRVQLLMALGHALDVQDRTAAAERAYRQVVKLAPGTAEAAWAQMTIVQGYLDRGRLADAARELERIVKAYPGTPAQAQAEFEAGSVYEAMRDPKRAEEAYRQVLEMAPQSPWGVEAQHCLVRLVEQKQ